MRPEIGPCFWFTNERGGRGHGVGGDGTFVQSSEQERRPGRSTGLAVSARHSGGAARLALACFDDGDDCGNALLTLLIDTNMQIATGTVMSRSF